MEGKTDTTPQAGEAEAAQADAGQVERFDPEYVKGLRREAAQYRTQAKEMAAKVAAYEAEKLSETERLQRQVQEAAAQAQAAQAALRDARFETALAREAVKVGLDPTLLAKLVSPEFDEEGKPVNVGAAVAKVLETYPNLKPQPAQAGSPTNPPRQAKLTMDDVRKMTPAQINARWDEVQAAMQAAGA